jgi:5-methylcytosine-specific restriction protein A
MPRLVPREPRRSAFSRGYTKAWSKKAKAFRLRYPLCGMRPGDQRPVMSLCDDDGRTTPATLVDHIVPHRGDPTLFNDDTNLQSLCDACHSRKTAIEDARDAETRA